MKKKNISILSSIWSMKCPRCREGDLFETGAFSFEKPFEMPDRCSHCGQNYMPEPGFYYGAMFISYIFYAWFCVGIGFPLIFLFDWSVNSAALLLVFITIILFVWIFRIARSIWIHIIVKYQPKIADSK